MQRMKFNNLSDGETDGIVLFYMKDKKLKCVVLTPDQADMLDLSLGIVFKEPLRVVEPSKEAMLGMIEQEETE